MTKKVLVESADGEPMMADSPKSAVHGAECFGDRCDSQGGIVQDGVANVSGGKGRRSVCGLTRESTPTRLWRRLTFARYGRGAKWLGNDVHRACTSMCTSVRMMRLSDSLPATGCRTLRMASCTHRCLMLKRPRALYQASEAHYLSRCPHMPCSLRGMFEAAFGCGSADGIPRYSSRVAHMPVFMTFHAGARLCCTLVCRFRN